MSDDVPTPIVESKWSNVLEYAVFGFPAMVGIACLLALFGGSFAGPGPMVGLVAALWLVSLLGGLVLTGLIAVSLYFDAKAVAAADAEWNPSPGLYAVAGILFSGLTALHYLYKRYEHTAAAPGRGGWWYGVAACLAVVVVAGATSALPVPADAGAVGVVFVSAGVLPIAIYKDAAHVRARGGDWLPNPVNYFLATFFGSFLLVVPAAVGGYYLYKRHAHVGAP